MSFLQTGTTFINFLTEHLFHEQLLLALILFVFQSVEVRYEAHVLMFSVFKLSFLYVIHAFYVHIISISMTRYLVLKFLF